MAEKSYRAWLWGLALLGFVIDQASKYLVFRWLYTPGLSDSREIIPGAFQLLAQHTEQRDAGGLLAPLRTWGGEHLPKVNHGALFGLANDYQYLANSVFAVVSVLAAGAIAYWSTRAATARDRWLCAALGLILGGTLGNLYDRLVFHGVRDFLYFYWINWPVFNVADCCLVCGAFLLLTQAFAGHHEAAPGQEPTAAVLSSEGARAE
jgi:lipoprotein signal peptidase